MEASVRKTGPLVWISAALIMVLVGYPLSIGPACWISSWTGLGGETLLATAYTPMLLAADHGPDSILSAIHWYSQIGARADWAWGEIVFAEIGGKEVSGGYLWLNMSAP